MDIDLFVMACVEGVVSWPRSEQRRFKRAEAVCEIDADWEDEPVRLAELDRLRDRLYVTQRELCALAGINESTLTRIRQEKREPTPRIARRLQVALKTIQLERAGSFAALRP